MSKKYSDEQIATWKANRKKWVEALRSGDYEQGSGVLFDGKKYCCIGVGATVAGLAPELRRPDGEWHKKRYHFGALYTAADASVRSFYGLRTEGGIYRRPIANGGGSLVMDNDFGVPFALIADIIESEPPGLFLESQESNHG